MDLNHFQVIFQNIDCSVFSCCANGKNLGPVLPPQKIVYTPLGLSPVATYVPRPKHERKLDDQLPEKPPSATETRTVVVWGLGGTGKSQLVLNYVQKHQHHYQNLFWIGAGQKQTIERQYLEIYKLLPNMSYDSSTTSINDAVAAVKSWLYRQDGRSLWVMDSADAIEDTDDASFVDLNFYLPDGPRLDRIITTRSSRARDMSSRDGVEVAEMADGEAVQLFQKCAKLGQTSEKIQQAISEIVEELGYLALAVTLAGSYVRETPRLAANISLYLPEYRTRRDQLLSRSAHLNIHGYSDSVLSTWEISLSAVERQSPLAAQLLNLLAFINFDDIFLGLFQVFSDPLAPKDALTEGKSAQWVRLLLPSGGPLNAFMIEDGFATLRAYSLVSLREEQSTYIMHKLVHAWGHDRLETAQRQKWALAALELLAQMACNCDGDLSRSTRLVPHVMANFAAVSTAYKAHNMEHHDRQSMAAIVALLRRLGRWDYEHDMQEFLLQKTESILGREHSDTLKSMNDLGVVLGRQGKYKEAEEKHQETLGLKEQALGPEHPDTLTSMNNLAAAFSEQGKYKEAEENHRRTLELRKKVRGLEHHETLTSMSNLGVVLSQQGKYKEAEEKHRETLRLRKSVLNPEHRSTLMSMNNLAAVLSKQGKYKEAEEMHEETLGIRKRVLGPEHPDTLTSMNNLAEVLSMQGKYEVAGKTHQEALELRKKVLGPEHPSTLISMKNLARVQKKGERGEKGEEGNMRR